MKINFRLKIFVILLFFLTLIIHMLYLKKKGGLMKCIQIIMKYPIAFSQLS